VTANAGGIRYAPTWHLIRLANLMFWSQHVRLSTKLMKNEVPAVIRQAQEKAGI
jgi:hypothetical protein